MSNKAQLPQETSEPLVSIQQEDLSSDNKKAYNKVYLYSKTAVLIYSWICLGLYSEFIGPSLPELQRRVSSNYEEIGRALMTRDAGYFTGSLFGGILVDKFRSKRILILSIALTCAGCTIIVLPFCRTLWFLCLVLFCGGLCHGVHTTGGNPSLAELWKEKASGPLNLMHAGYGAGAAISPMIIKSFVIKLDTFNNSSINESFIPLLNQSNFNTSSQELLPNLEISYSIIATACILCGILFFILIFISNPLSSGSEAQHQDVTLKQLIKDNMKAFNILYLVVIFFTYMTTVGNERVFGKFLFSYATNGHLKVEKNSAYLFNTLYWILFCTARILSFFILLKVKVHIIYLIQISCTCISAILLNVYPSSLLLFYISASMFGFFKSPLFPTCLALINRYLEVTGLVTLVVNLGSSIGGMSLQYLTGYLMQNVGLISFLYVVLGTAILLFIGGLVLYFVGRYKGERFFVRESDQNNEMEFATNLTANNDQFNDKKVGDQIL